MSFGRYAAFAYTGALIWISVFVFLGKFLGLQWNLIRKSFDLDVWGFVLVLVLIFIFYLYKNIRGKSKYLEK